MITQRSRDAVAVKLPSVRCNNQYADRLHKQNFSRRSKINIPCTMLVTTCMGTSPARKGAVGGTSRASTPNQVQLHLQPMPVRSLFLSPEVENAS